MFAILIQSTGGLNWLCNTNEANGADVQDVMAREDAEAVLVVPLAAFGQPEVGPDVATFDAPKAL